MTTITHFLALGGYGIYVWSAYGFATLALILLWRQPWRTRS